MCSVYMFDCFFVHYDDNGLRKKPKLFVCRVGLESGFILEKSGFSPSVVFLAFMGDVNIALGLPPADRYLPTLPNFGDLAASADSTKSARHLRAATNVGRSVGVADQHF